MIWETLQLPRLPQADAKARNMSDGLARAATRDMCRMLTPPIFGGGETNTGVSSRWRDIYDASDPKCPSTILTYTDYDDADGHTIFSRYSAGFGSLMFIHGHNSSKHGSQV